MSERISGALRNALYKYVYTILCYYYRYKEFRGGLIRTHSRRNVIEEQFAKHLPVGSPQNLAERRPRRLLVRRKYRLECDAEADDKYGQHEQELDQLGQLQQQPHQVF